MGSGAQTPAPLLAFYQVSQLPGSPGFLFQSMFSSLASEFTPKYYEEGKAVKEVPRAGPRWAIQALLYTLRACFMIEELGAWLSGRASA